MAELTALVGSRVAGEHRHPALVGRFTVLEGELTVELNGQTSILRQGEMAAIEAGVWHDWWNGSSRDVRVRVEITPGLRFVHMIETFFGLARLAWPVLAPSVRAISRMLSREAPQPSPNLPKGQTVICEEHPQALRLLKNTASVHAEA